MSIDKQIIILAAGRGSRMDSDIPKVMHKVDGVPMLERVISSCKAISNDLILVYSKILKPYLSELGRECKLVYQEEQLGTGHAVSVAKGLFSNKYIGVVYADNPLTSPKIIADLFSHIYKKHSAVATLAFNYKKPNQYGRIILDQNGKFKKIVETKFANNEEKKIELCNSGIMAFAPRILEKYIDKCINQDNSPTESRLTDMIEICLNCNEKVSYLLTDEPVIGVNTQDELIFANSLISQKQ